MTLYILEKEQGLELDLIYNRDLFDVEYIQSIGEQYCSLLEQVLQKSDCEICVFQVNIPPIKPIQGETFTSESEEWEEGVL